MEHEDIMKFVVEQDAKTAATMQGYFDKRFEELKDHARTTSRLDRATIVGEFQDLREEMEEDFNERMDSMAERIHDVDENTKFAQWLQRNKHRAWAMAGVLIVAIILGAAVLAPRIDPKRTIEKVTPIEFKDEAQRSEQQSDQGDS